MPEACAAAIAASLSFLACLHSLQRLGGFCRFLSLKKACSPAVHTKVLLQSPQTIGRSENSLSSTGATDALYISLTDICTLLVRYLLVLYGKSANRYGSFQNRSFLAAVGSESKIRPPYSTLITKLGADYS